MTTKIKCCHCGEILAETNEEYVRQYPNSLGSWKVQLRKEHTKYSPQCGDWPALEIE